MKKSFVLAAVVTLLVIVCFEACKNENDNVVVDVEYKKAPARLSDYHFFNGDIKNLEPNKGVLPYDLITPLFSDYAYKARFVWMPAGTMARYTKDEVLEFPVGTALIKNFYYPFDFRNPVKGRRIIETRLLIRRQEKWDALTYVWNDEQTDAALNVIGGTTSVNWIDKEGIAAHDDYSIPNKNQCKTCHSMNGQFVPIGPKVRNLNHDFAYTSGIQNQLDYWVKAGMLLGYTRDENTTNRMAKWDDTSSGSVNERARAYLDANCAYCHRREGTANPTGLYLVYTNHDAGSLGVMKTPEAAGSGAADFLYDIVPGKPGESIMPYRMSINTPGRMMPQIGRKLVHKEAVTLIQQWIAAMKQ